MNNPVLHNLCPWANTLSPGISQLSDSMLHSHVSKSFPGQRTQKNIGYQQSLVIIWKTFYFVFQPLCHKPLRQFSLFALENESSSGHRSGSFLFIPFAWRIGQSKWAVSFRPQVNTVGFCWLQIWATFKKGLLSCPIRGASIFFTTLHALI